MDDAAPFLVLALGAAALLYMTSASANTQTSSADPFAGLLDNLNSATGSLFGMGNDNLNGYDANLSAFLYMLRMGESSNRYNVIYGGQTFSDYSHHPDIAVPIASRPGWHSTAAGAYQFIYSTWQQIAAEAGLVDFTPASQDAGAAQYLTDLGAMPFIEAGDVQGAISQINSTGIIFQSLAVRPYATLAGWYQSAGGALA
ncbi:glycoside hydrolase family protein [Trinickia sp. EG282A]|uniref:glycoside hydrolase family protein n=1 Tax=Trinickia sp. EG282A TaxID=3237013 RepID=UPI0034D27943